MIIGIDANEANITHRVGVGQYAFNLIHALSDFQNQHKFHLYLKESPLPDMPKATSNWQYHLVGPRKLWTKFALPIHLYLNHKTKLDLFFSPSHYSPHLSPVPTIPTIHDLGYLQSPDQFNTKDIHQLVHWTKHSLNHASHIIAVSEFTKNELNRIYSIPSSKITVAPNGVGDVPTNLPKNTIDKFNITSPYFLYLGTLKPNKNISFLIRSFAQFLQNSTASKLHGSKSLSLVIAGKKGWHFDDVFATVTETGIENRVIFTDYIDEDDKWSLLKSAQALIIPSTYEGFGIPAIEAMKVGTPVIVSHIPAFIEVVGDSGLFIDPHNSNDLVLKMIKILDPATRTKLVKRGAKQSQKYTWKLTAKQALLAFNQV